MRPKTKRKNTWLMYILVFCLAPGIFYFTNGRHPVLAHKTIANFGFLDYWMSFDEVVDAVGLPDRQYENLKMAEYDLDDGSVVELHFSKNYHLKTASQIGTDGDTPILSWLPLKTGKQASTLDRWDFLFLRRGMSYYEIVHRVGPADANSGFGLLILCYRLKNGSYICLTFRGIDELWWARLNGDNLFIWGFPSFSLR